MSRKQIHHIQPQPESLTFTLIFIKKSDSTNYQFQLNSNPKPKAKPTTILRIKHKMGNHINPSSTKRAYTESLPRPKASSPKLAQHRAKYGIKEINNIIHVSKRSDDPETSNQTNKRN